MNTYTVERTLVERILAKLSEVHCNKAELAMIIGENRSTVSNYLNNHQERIAPGKIKELESKIEDFLKERGEASCYAEDVERTPESEDGTQPTTLIPVSKAELFESRDYRSIMALCNSCQEIGGLGIIVGKSGYGKTFTLKKYAKLPRVVHIECNEAMNCKDIVRKIERSIGLPKTYGSIDERLEHITSFFNMNRGYLLIVDEADKLISKYTQKKIEILRYIADGANVGIVIAGEPYLESAVKAFDNRFANRMDFYYKLTGLSKSELEKYFTGYSIDAAAMDEFIMRACNSQTGCFRLLDRTLNNVIRILRENGKNVITIAVIREASNMMML